MLRISESTNGFGRARFFKTRSLAAEAVSGGKIEINGERAKPSRVVRIGDKVGIRRGPYDWTIIVKDASRLRGSAPQAQQLYEETEESRRKREAAIAQLRLERPPELAVPGRPSKKRSTRHPTFYETRMVLAPACDFNSL